MRLIVHADDLGMSEAVDNAVIEALAEGTATSTSVLATGPTFEAALARLPRDTCLGVHLDLTGFPALTGSSVLEEWRAQVAKVRAAGWEPTHMDSHQHVHWKPFLWPFLRTLMEETGIRAVRGIGAWRPEVSRLRELPQRARAARFRRAFSGFVTTDGFANASTFRAREEAGAQRPDTLEVMVHPGNPAHDRYAVELAWMREGAWRAGTTPVSWRDLVGEWPRNGGSAP